MLNRLDYAEQDLIFLFKLEYANYAVNDNDKATDNDNDIDDDDEYDDNYDDNDDNDNNNE